MRNIILKSSMAIAGVAVALLAFVTPALAQTTTTLYDPTNGQFTAGVDQNKSFITDTAFGPILLLAVVVVGLFIAIKWVKRVKAVT